MFGLQVKEKIIDQVYRNLPYSQRPKVECVALGKTQILTIIRFPPLLHHYSYYDNASFICVQCTEWRPGSTGQILSDMDLTSQKEGRWKRLNTLAHYNVGFSDMVS